ncbi:uncharacterized protein C10orf67 homolog, mitochondrial isoform X2 [Rhineura floridana]|nr:uncharacterized protein C10orf67 homolog, mitochondrial isoform X2 [Rhineura floridana]
MLYDDFAMYKNVLKAQYEEKIQEQATKLWLEINDRLKYIEDFYKQKEVKMRYSYQQQLCDALAVLRTNYAKYFLIGEETPGDGEEPIAAKIQRLRNKLEEQAATIESLEAALQEYKQRDADKVPHDLEIERELLQQANWELKGEMASLLDKFTRLQETVKRRERERTGLETEIKHMQDKREKDMKTIEKLMKTQEILKLELDREKQRVLAKALEVKEAQEAAKLAEAKAAAVPKVPSAQEPKAEKKGAKGPKAAKAAAAKEAAAKEAAAKESAAIEAATLKQAEEKKALHEEIKRLKKAEREAKLHAQRLEQELQQSGRSWQMKFEILKKSLHAIKDEMFLRQSLRHSAKFRIPSLADRTAPPLHIQSSAHKNASFTSSLYMQYAPLPKIGSQTDLDSNEEELDMDKIPVTIEIPSAYEGDSMDEEDFEQLPPLPSSRSSVP